MPEDKLDKVLKMLGGIEKRLTDVENKDVKAEECDAKGDPYPSAKDMVTPEVEKKTTQYPIPEEFIQAKEEILGKEFGMELKPSAGSPSFTISIVVPESMSNMSKAEWDVKKVDIRSKVLTYSEGVAGLKEWLLKVAANLKLIQTGPVAFGIGKKPAPNTTGAVPVSNPPNITPNL